MTARIFTHILRLHAVALAQTRKVLKDRFQVREIAFETGAEIVGVPPQVKSVALPGRAGHGRLDTVQPNAFQTPQARGERPQETAGGNIDHSLDAVRLESIGAR